MKVSKPVTMLVLVALTGSLAAQTKGKALPTGNGQTAALFEGRTSPASEKRIKEANIVVETQAQTILRLEARVKELEAELAALKATQAAKPVSAAPVVAQ